MQNSTPENQQGNSVPEARRPDGWKWTVKTQLPSDTVSKEQAEKNQEEFTRHVGEVFKMYNDTLAKDKAEFGNNPRYIAYNQECAQLFNEYSKVTPNGQTPTTPEDMATMLRSIQLAETTMKQYAADRENTGKGADPSKFIERSPKVEHVSENLENVEKFDWMAEAPSIFRSHQEFVDSAEEGLRNSDLFKEYVKKDAEYYSIYQEFAFPRVKDEAMCRTVIWEMKKMENAYQPALKAWVEAKKKNPVQSADFSLDALEKMVGATTLGRETYLKQVFGVHNDSPTKNIDVRQLMIELSRDKKKGEFPALTPEQLRAVLFMKAHMRDIGGQVLPGEKNVSFNRADVRPVAEAIKNEKFAKPRELYEKILENAEKSTNPADKLTEQDKLGLRVMIDELNGITFAKLRARKVSMQGAVATYAEHQQFDQNWQRLESGRRQIIEGEGQLAKGIKLRDRLAILPRNKGRSFIPLRPLHNIIGRKVDEGAAKLAAGKAKYFDGLRRKAKYDESKNSLPERITQGVMSQFNEQLDGAHVGYTDAVDTTPRPNVTQDFMEKKIGEQLKILDTISKENTNTISKVTGLDIKAVNPNGLNLDTLNWILTAQASPTGADAKFGMPPGTMLRVTEAAAVASPDKVADANEEEQ